MKVQIDSREQHRIKRAKSYFESQGLTVTIEELQIGDYIFSDGTDEVVFEFKMVSDFIASIQDGRVFNQCIEQSENFNHHFCIIHGDLATRSKCIAMSRNYREITVFQYLSAIASINKYSTVIETYSPFLEESFYRMMIQSKKCLSKKPIVKKFPRKDKNPIRNFLMYCIYGVSATKADEIIQTHNIRNLNDLKQLTLDDLTMVEGIGKKTAQNILSAIGEL